MTALVLAVATALFALSVVLPVVHRLLDRRTPPHPGRSAPPDGTTGRNTPPSLEVVVPAYLESTVIAAKVDGLRAALRGYPGPSSVTVVASDPATAAAAGAADVVLRVGRHGKPAAVNAAVARSAAEVIVLTDANCEIGPIGWPAMVVDELSEWRMVSANKRERGGHERLFWSMEQGIKAVLHRSGGTVTVVGEFLAFRAADYRPVPADELCDDLWLALDFDERGLPVTVSPRIHTSEQPASPDDQWERRVRMAEGVLGQTLPRLPRLVRTRLGRGFVAHKLYRLTLGCLAFWTAVVAAAFLAAPFSVVVVPAGVLVALLGYRGRVGVPALVAPLVTVVGMQAVPLAGALRAWRRARGRSGASLGWVKVAR